MNPKWYHTWWGVVVLSFLLLLCAGVVFFVGTTIRYWWQIKHGITPAFLKENTAQFTVSTQAQGGEVDRASLETADSPWLGRFGATTTIVEFIDFKCPNCQIAASTVHLLDAQFHDRVRIIVRHFPAETLHPGATELSILGYCAQKQNKFWPLYDILFNQQSNLPNPLDSATINNLADAVGLKLTDLTACMKSPSANAAVTRDYLDGVRAGVRGTPTYFVNGEKVEGVIPVNLWTGFLSSH